MNYIHNFPCPPNYKYNSISIINDCMHSHDTIYLDAEDTLYDCLQENNPNALNSTTFSVSRTAQAITQRVDEASRRLASIEEYSLKKKKSFACTGLKNGSHANNANIVCYPGVNPTSASQMKTIKTNKKICCKHQCEKCGKNFNEEECDRELLSKIKDMSIELKNNKTIIYDLEDKISNLEVQNIKMEQKFLQQEQKYLLKINQLTKLLEEAEQKQWRMECEKSELFDQLSQAQNKAVELEEKLLNCGEQKLLWKKKDSALTGLKKKYVQSLQKKQANMESINQSNNEAMNLLKQFIRNLKNIIETGQAPTKFFSNHNGIVNSVSFPDKAHQNSKKTSGLRKTIQPVGHIVAPMAQSYCITEGECQDFEIMGGGAHSEEILAPLSLFNMGSQGQNQSKTQELYRMLFVQAETIEKLGLL